MGAVAQTRSCTAHGMHGGSALASARYSITRTLLYDCRVDYIRQTRRPRPTSRPSRRVMYHCEPPSPSRPLVISCSIVLPVSSVRECNTLL
ncbi:hypothetical protein BDU57DRAFT_79368 [Ampelomyces quisqualis]|uniref:Uncharacterized protein n=1 Tax=Ampelomyces quisqualis TaxID=50730 RepID=A0A6A5Q8Y7_AMPQU|nr:hypothetical protein BDU57DRAFT_79368 [Ampelomyces quisqualis]